MKKIPKYLYFVTALLIISATVVVALDNLDPTDTWNVTPILKTFPGDRACPVGSTLLSDQFQSVTQGIDNGTATATYIIDGKEVTVNLTIHADNSFDFEVVGGVMPQMFVKGSNYLLYQYVPKVSGASNDGPVSYDTGLHDGVNPKNENEYQDVSHLDFCITPVNPLSATKTANTSYTRTYTWDITKDFDGEYWKFIGDLATSHGYKVAVDQTITDSAFKVTGNITITNPNPFAVAFSVSDTVNGMTANVTCDDFTLDPNETKICTYIAELGDTLPPDGTNTAVITSPVAEGVTATADYTFDKATIAVEGFSTINVTDTNGQAWSASGDDDWEYTKDFSCPTDTSLYVNGVYSIEHMNIASITETKQSNEATVTVHCYAPVLDKDAAGSYDEVHKWDVEKTVDLTKQSAFIGDTVDFDWIVTVTETVKDENISVSGTIYVKNPAPMPMTVTILDYLNGNDTAPATILPGEKCDYADGSLTIPAESMAECKYLAEPDDYKAELNTVMATINSVVFTATADVAWTSNVINPEVTVDDDLYSEFPETISEGDVWTYSGRYTCSTNLNDYTGGKDLDNKVDNTAVIKSGDILLDESTATTVIDCYAPVVKKTAQTSLERTWNWKIGKVGKDPLLGGQLESLTLSVGQVYEVLYGVTVGAISSDSGWEINGTITVANPADKPMTVKLSDSLDDGTLVTIDYCETPAAEFVLIDGMLTVPAGMTATCYYSASPEDDSATLNTATATLNDIDFTATAEVDFSQATGSETDECIDVTDDQYGDLGTVCANEGTKTFKYEMLVGPYDVCGEYEFVNVASFVTNDTGTTGSDSWTIVVDVPCGGCTLTIGYWKTHSIYGPAPHDETWALLGEDTIFFQSGKTYYEVMWTPPAGNAYYILAPQYVAAKLNMLNGASVPSEVQAAFDEATALFETYTPAEIAKLKGKAGTELRAKFIALANILDKYNNGEMGIPYCSE